MFRFIGKLNQMKCSFCGKPDARVEKLIAGPRGIYICGACVATCNQILEKDARVPIR